MIIARLTVIDFNDPGRHPCEKHRVMGDEDERAWEIHQRIGENVDGWGIEMIGRLIQQESVGRFPKHACQGDAIPLTPA